MERGDGRRVEYRGRVSQGEEGKGQERRAKRK